MNGLSNDILSESDNEIEEPIVKDVWVPQFVQSLEDLTVTFRYQSPLPKQISEKLEKTEPIDIVLGIDEAGRGPVIGPMVYAVAYTTKEHQAELSNIPTLKDSKVMSALQRDALMKEVCNTDSKLSSYIGFAIFAISALEISEKMLSPISPTSLNVIAQNATQNLIESVLSLTHQNTASIYVDTIGPPETYQRLLCSYFPMSDIVVEKKADSKYPIVSMASVCAKTTRDAAVFKLQPNNQSWGSGYPSDPRAIEYLNNNVDHIFGWTSRAVRYSWQTVQRIFESKVKQCKVTWQHGGQRQLSFYSKSSRLADSDNYGSNWYGRRIPARATE